MKAIPLTRGKVAIVDDEDFESLSMHKWHAKRNRNTYYAVRSVRTDGRRSQVLMHRVILGAKPGEEVDHISGNGIDNRRSNLRLASRSENASNQKMRRDNTSGVKGVYRRGRKWCAQIIVKGHQIHLGCFHELDAAEAVYHAAALAHFGAFARPERRGESELVAL